MKSKSRGRPFEVKRTHHVRETDVSRPRGGADMSAGAAQTRPLLGTDSEHPKSGVAIRAEEGMEAVQPSEVPLEVSSEGSSEGSEKRRGRDPKAWPVPEGGYVSAWDIDFDWKAGR